MLNLMGNIRSSVLGLKQGPIVTYFFAVGISSDCCRVAVYTMWPEVGAKYPSDPQRQGTDRRGGWGHRTWRHLLETQGQCTEEQAFQLKHYEYRSHAVFQQMQNTLSICFYQSTVYFPIHLACMLGITMSESLRKIFSLHNYVLTLYIL